MRGCTYEREGYCGEGSDQINGEKSSPVWILTVAPVKRYIGGNYHLLERDGANC